MANRVMRKYEVMFLVDSASAASNWDATVKTIETIMDRAGAQSVNLKKWDDRRLCYPIKGHNRGTYILAYFEADPTSITGMERDVQISEEILRALILNAENIPDDIINMPTPDQLADKKQEEPSDESDPVDREGDAEEDEEPDIEDITE